MGLNAGSDFDAGWTSKQRTQSAPIRRLQKPVEPVATGKHRFDGYSDSFIDLIYKRKPKMHKRIMCPVTRAREEMMSLLERSYKYPQPPPYRADKVIRRMELPAEKFGIEYSANTELSANLLATNRIRKKQAVEMAVCNNGSEFTGVGVGIGRVPYIESNPRDVLIEHLKDGLSSKVLSNIYNIKARTLTEDMLGSAQSSIENYINELRKNVKETFKKGQNLLSKARANIRQTNSAMSEGSRQMYKLLRETEHRLLHIQAGGTYNSHQLSCQKRRKIEKNMLGSQYMLEKLPAGNDSDDIVFPDFFSKPSIRKVLNKIKNASLITLKLRSLKKKKQEYCDKLVSVYDVLCIMKQMKQPTSRPAPLSWKQLKKYRHDPYESDRNKSPSTYAAKSAQHTATELTANRPRTVKHSGIGHQLSTTDHPNAVRPSTVGHPSRVNLQVNRLVNHPVTANRFSTKKIVTFTGGVNHPSTINRPGMVNRPKTKKTFTTTGDKSIVKEPTGPPVPKIVVPQQRNGKPVDSVRLKAGEDVHSSLSTSSSGPFLQPTDYGYNPPFDPNMITWEEFLKYREKPDRLADLKAYKKAKFVKSQPYVLPRGKSLTASESTAVIRKSINHVWSMMRRSFLKTITKQKKPVSLLQRHPTGRNPLFDIFQTDKTNPVEHCQMTWLKIKSRGNRDLLLRIQQRYKDTQQYYTAIKKCKELSDTSKYKHTWSLDYNRKKRMAAAKEQEHYIECAEVLKREAILLGIHEKSQVKELLRKIQKICLEPIIKRTTIHKGKCGVSSQFLFQLKVLQIILSLPAFELCTIEMQSAIQFVLMEVLNGDADMLTAMMKQRGLPLHPALSQLSAESTDALNLQGQAWHRLTDKGFVLVNKELSSLPPDRFKGSRQIHNKLITGMIYSNY